MSLLMTLTANSILFWAHVASRLLPSTACTLLGGVFVFAIPNASVGGAAATMLLTGAALLMVLMFPATVAGVNFLESRCVRSAENILLLLDGFPLADAFLRFF